MRIGFLVALTAIATQAASLHSQPAVVPGPSYPGWFLRAPTSTLTAVGIAPRYATDSSSIAEATERARAALALAVRSKVSVQMATEAYANVRDFQGEEYSESALDDQVPFVVLDTAFVDKLVLVLVGAGRVPFRDEPVAMPDSAPAWVGVLPVAPRGSTVIGSAPLYYYEQNSWIEAEARARRAAAFDGATRLKTLERSSNGDYSSVTVSSTAAILQGAQVVQRWRDARMVYVLMHVTTVQSTGR